MKDAPSLLEMHEAAMSGSLDDVRVCLPGRIEKYDSSTRRAVVQILTREASVGEDGERQIEVLKPLTDVPVAMLGSGSVRIKITPAPGDPCWLLFASSSIGRLKAGRDPSAVYDPGDDRHHHEADAIALPLVVLGTSVETLPLIEFTPLLVKLGDVLAAQSVIRGEAYLTAFSTLIGAIATAVGGIPGGAAAGTAISTALTTFLGAQSTYLSAKVKVS